MHVDLTAALGPMMPPPAADEVQVRMREQGERIVHEREDRVAEEPRLCRRSRWARTGPVAGRQCQTGITEGRRETRMQSIAAKWARMHSATMDPSSPSTSHEIRYTLTARCHAATRTKLHAWTISAMSAASKTSTCARSGWRAWCRPFGMTCETGMSCRRQVRRAARTVAFSPCALRACSNSVVARSPAHLP
jgi:hypothetical protein